MYMFLILFAPYAAVLKTILEMELWLKGIVKCTRFINGALCFILGTKSWCKLRKNKVSSRMRQIYHTAYAIVVNLAKFLTVGSSFTLSKFRKQTKIFTNLHLINENYINIWKPLIIHWQNCLFMHSIFIIGSKIFNSKLFLPTKWCLKSLEPSL